MLRRSGIELDVLLVDDSSPDNTAGHRHRRGRPARHQARGAHRLAPRRRSARSWPASSICCAPADRDFFVTLDPDGHHDARQITDLVRSFVAHRSGVTIGSRWVRGGSSPGTSACASVVSRTANIMARRVIGLHGVHDATTSFRVIRPDVAAVVDRPAVPTDGYGYFTTTIAVAQAAGFSITECPITFRPRYAGVQSLSFSDVTAFWRACTRPAPWSPRSAPKLAATRRPGRRVRRACRPSRRVELAVRRGRGVENLAQANRFFGWIADELAPHLGHRFSKSAPESAPSRPRSPNANRPARSPRSSRRRTSSTSCSRQPRGIATSPAATDLAGARVEQTTAVRFDRLRQRARAHPRRRRRDADRVRSGRPGGSLGVFVPAMSRCTAASTTSRVTTAGTTRRCCAM